MPASAARQTVSAILRKALWKGWPDARRVSRRATSTSISHRYSCSIPFEEAALHRRRAPLAVHVEPDPEIAAEVIAETGAVDAIAVHAVGQQGGRAGHRAIGHAIASQPALDVPAFRESRRGGDRRAGEHVIGIVGLPRVGHVAFAPDVDAGAPADGDPGSDRGDETGVDR